MFIIYNQTRMTPVKSSGVVSRSTQLELVQLKDSVPARQPSFSLHEMKLQERNELRNIPGIVGLLTCTVARVFYSVGVL